jgi:hypothetical protein
MCDLGVRMVNEGVSVALLQEPYVSGGCVRGLPGRMQVFLSDDLKSAVVVNDVNLEVVLMNDCVSEHGVCVWMKGEYGELYVVSMYCQYGCNLEPYLRCLDRVYELVNGKNLLIGMDANAVSPLWHSKMRTRGGENEERGRIWEEWIMEKGMFVLNEPCECYTFSGARGESDIDVTLCNKVGMYQGCEWSVMSEWSISDHNVIVVRMRYNGNEMTDERVLGKRWSLKGVDWDEYVCKITERAEEFGIVRFERLDTLSKLNVMMEWILKANDDCMKEIKGKYEESDLVDA